MAGPLAILILVGCALPLSWGLWLPLLVVLGLWVILTRRSAALEQGVASSGGWGAVLDAMSPRENRALLALAVLPSIVLATVGARSIGALMVAYPAGIWGLALALAGAVAMRWITGRRTRIATALVVALLVPVAGVLGTRYEAGAPGARAVAHSGPILGIHPFQTTAVLIDGHGPFDLPLNDYVEPDGHRGYGPEALAAAFELALHDIARIHYSDGPARARTALGEATAVAAWIPAVRETLDGQPADAEQPHFEVRSGTFGRRSRVEFVCPGARNDPRGRQPDPVMTRMCPDKYASEASAGLGVTGRWTGYTEIRGSERLSLARWMGWTRSADAEGRRIVELEQRVWAWSLLALLLLACLGRRRTTVAGLREVGGAVALVATIALVVLALAWAPVLQVGFVERAPSWVDATRLEPWLPALALCFGLVELDRLPPVGPGGRGGARWWPGIVFVPVVVVTSTLAGALSAHTWIRPSLWGHDGTLALEAFVEHVADRLAVRGGLNVLEMEGAVAASLAVTLLAMLAYMPAVVSRALVRDTGGARSRRWIVAATILLPAAFLVVSRKTEGASTLIPGAIAMAAVLASALNLVVRRRRPGAVWRGAAHVAWTLLAMALLLETLRRVPEVSAFLLLCVVVGGLAMVLGLSLVLGPVPWRPDGPQGPRLPGEERLSPDGAAGMIPAPARAGSPHLSKRSDSDMKPRSVAVTRSLLDRLFCLVVACALAFAPTPGLAAAPAEGEPSEAAPATVSGKVALLRFSGSGPASDLRSSVQEALQSEGFTVKTVALTIEAAAKKVRCKKGEVGDDCLARLGKWLNKNKRTAADYIVYATVTTSETETRAQVVTYDTAKAERIKTWDATYAKDDFILPLSLPRVIGRALADHVVPPEPATEDEQRTIAELDEPAKTPEEIAAEKRAIEEAERAAAAEQRRRIDMDAIKADLKKDFKSFCRTGKREKRKSKDDPKDLSPKCQRGPFWGYWQPRAFVAMGLTVGAGLTMAAFYGIALAKRRPYKDAVDELDAYMAEADAQHCDPRQNPYCTELGGVAYSDLATEVSKTSAAVRENAIIGDAMLGATVLLAGVLGIIIYQDRADGKKYIKQEKQLRAISDVRVGPMVGRANGAVVGFQF